MRRAFLPGGLPRENAFRMPNTPWSGGMRAMFWLTFVRHQKAVGELRSFLRLRAIPALSLSQRLPSLPWLAGNHRSARL